MPDLIVLDQNVCLHISRFYFGKSRDHAEDIEQLLLSFPYSRFRSSTHITSGWGVEENAWKRTGEFDEMQKRSLQWATERVLDWEPERVKAEFSNKQPPWKRDKKWAKGVPFPWKDHHPLQGLIMSYAPMLRLSSLFQGASKRGGRWAFDQYVEWMMHEFGYLLSYESALAAQALLGEGNAKTDARGIFHLGGGESPDKLANKAWSAAWDMQYARLIDLGPMGLARIAHRRFRKVAIVTQDDDLVDSKSRAQHIETIRGYSMYLMPSEVELSGSKHVDDLGYGISLLKRTKPRNPRCDPMEALDTLERSIGVQRRTITAFRQHPGGDVSPSLLAQLKELDERKQIG
ncbi:hypothetical protein [Mycobacterium sp. 96-892]|uniref:hypothetical protein n=1 Tax=Mycobacterium sp. 96-892 TaxID=1855664 RepID=UPI0011164DBC|nr:hypothetical protein [Mycobacterium sp. 96-892]